MKLVDLDDYASQIPFVWVGTSLVFGFILDHLLLVGVRSWCVRSISLGGTCGGVLAPLIGIGTPSTFDVGCISQARWG